MSLKHPSSSLKDKDGSKWIFNCFKISLLNNVLLIDPGLGDIILFASAKNVWL
jgi:hypothetical protein